MIASFVPVMTLSFGDVIMNEMENLHVRSVHLDIGSSIQANKDSYVRVPSKVLKVVNKLFTMNFMEW